MKVSHKWPEISLDIKKVLGQVNIQVQSIQNQISVGKNLKYLFVLYYLHCIHTL